MPQFLPSKQIMTIVLLGLKHNVMLDSVIPNSQYLEIIFNSKAYSTFAGSETHPQYVQPPVIPGHEFIGEVVKLGPGILECNVYLLHNKMTPYVLLETVFTNAYENDQEGLVDLVM